MFTIDKFKFPIVLKKRRGSALVFTIYSFLIITILSSSVIFLFNTNLKQAKYQEDALEAYYLAYSGIEMGFAAITTNIPVGYHGTSTYLNELSLGNITSLREDDISFGGGTIDILAKKTDDTNFEDWIKITSTGTLEKNNQSYTRSLYVNPSNPNDIIWINE